MAGGSSRKMRELTAKRAAAAMPVASSYRAIDFALSNMTIPQNGGISEENRVVCMYLHRRSLRITGTGTEEQPMRSIRIWIS